MLLALLTVAKYDDTITLGNILTTVSVIIACFTLIGKVTAEYARVESRFAILETKINVMYTWFEHKVGEATSISAKVFHGEIRPPQDDLK